MPALSREVSVKYYIEEVNGVIVARPMKGPRPSRDESGRGPSFDAALFDLYFNRLLREKILDDSGPLEARIESLEELKGELQEIINKLYVQQIKARQEASDAEANDQDE